MRPRTATGAFTSAFWVFVWTAAGLGIGFVTSAVTADSLGREDRGALAVLQTGSAITYLVLAFGVPAAITYYGSRRPRHRGPLLMLAFLQTGAITVVVLVAALTIGPALLRPFVPHVDTPIVVLTALLVPVQFLQTSLLCHLNATRSYRLVNLLSVVGRVLALAVVAVVLQRLGWGVAGGLVVLATVPLSFVLGALPAAFRARPRWPSPPLVRAALGYGWKVQVANLVRLGAGRLDVLLLAALVDDRGIVGVYAVAQIFGELVIQIPRSLGFVVMPMIAADDAGTRRFSGLALRLNGSATLAAMAALAITAPFLVWFAFPKFPDAVLPIYLILPGVFATSAGNLCSYVLSARGRPGLTSVLATVGAAASVLFDVALIPRFGLLGAAVASSLGAVVFGVASVLTVARQDAVSPRSLLVLSRQETAAQVRAVLARVR